VRTILLLVASVLLILTGCAQQSQLSESGATSGSKKSIVHKRIPYGQRGAQQHNRQADDIWPIIEDGLWFSHDVPDRKVQRYIDWYTGNDSYFERTLTRASKYMPYVVARLQEHDLPLELALLPFIESAYNPFAYSHSHASGLWQFIPGTGQEMGLRQDWWYEGRRDIVDSTDAAIRYLKILNSMFDGDWLLTLAAYNSGPGTVSRAREANRQKGMATDYWSLDLRDETRNYVPRLVALAKVLSDPERFAVNRISIPAESHFTVVEVKEQVDLAQAAKLANISADEIYNLNPGFSRWVTPPNGPFRILLPSARADGFADLLARTPRQTWHPGGEYVVKAGDTLGRIAANHGITVNDLSQLNQLDSTLLQIGQVLRLPVSSTAASSLAANVAASPASPRTYQVKSGDSLWSIAHAHNTRVQDLLAWNGLDSGATLFPGQQLKIGSGSRSVAGSSAAGNSQVSYQVKRGDSLYEIARRFRVEVNDILAWNDLGQRQVIHPGQNLTLFPTR